MSGRARRVRTLAVRAPTDALARRAALLVEDALRTAAIPDADGGRVYVVRRLVLPTLAAGAAAATVSLAVERRLGSLRTTGVPAADPRAADADVVFFDDAADLHVRLLDALVCGRADAWFWRCAAPRLPPGASRDDHVRAALLRLGELPQGGPAVARTLESAAVAGRADDLLRTLRPADGPALLASVVPGHAARARGVAPRDDSRAPVRPRPPWPALLDAWTARWGSDDARALWLAASATLAARPALAAAPARLAAHAHALLADAIVAANAPAPVVARPAEAAPRGARSHADRAAVVADFDPAPSDPDPVAGVESGRVTGVPGRTADTAAGGLFLLLQALRRLGFDGFLEAHPALLEADLGRRVLVAVARRVRTPGDDPVFDAIASRPDDATADVVLERADFEPPAPWPPHLRNRFDGHGARAPRSGPTVVAAWIAAARWWCRRHARTGVIALVRRPAVVTVTRTHVDVRFDLRTADVRLRRAGLDLDPGWVPWLGRVVLFHYGSEP